MKNSTTENPTEGRERGCKHHQHDRLRVRVWRIIECDGRSRWVFAVVALVLAVVLTIHFVG